MRPYADTMRELIAGVGARSASVRGLPLLQQRDEVQTVAIVPLTGDRGLAGAFNAQMLRRAFVLERQLRGEGRGALAWRSARRGVRRSRSAATSSAGEYTASPTGPPTPTRRRSRTASPSSTSRARSTASCSSTTLRLAAHQRVTEQEILPISADILETDEEERRRTRMRGDFIFEPEPEEILERLLPVYVETRSTGRCSSRRRRSRARG